MNKKQRKGERKRELERETNVAKMFDSAETFTTNHADEFSRVQ